MTGKKLKRNKGITLVALVITIIVLLILATVSIRLVINNGILNKAKYAVDKYSEEEIKEQIKLAYLECETEKLSNSSLDTNSFVKNSLEKIFGARNVDIEGSKILIIKITNKDKEYKYILRENGSINIPTQWEDNGNETYTKGDVTLKIGDYINYEEPENLGYSGSWRVLGFENGKIKLMSSDDVDSLTLQGREGYNNGIDQLNTICEKYADKKYSIFSRSIKMDDINKLAGYDKTKWFVSDYPSYGSTHTYRLTEEGIQYKNENGENVTDTSIKKFVNIDGTELSNNQEISITSNYYGRTTLGLNRNSIKCKMIFNSGHYWTADQFVLPMINKGYVRWSIFYISKEGVAYDTRYPLWKSSERAGCTLTRGVRAVVYLNSFVEIDTENNQKDGSAAELAYEIK